MTKPNPLKKNVKTEALSITKYAQFLDHIKSNILQAQLKAALSITAELTLLYWNIGKSISEKMASEGWGTKIMETLAHDLEQAFPGITGFSFRNLRYMRKFAETYQKPNLAAAAAKLPWGHNMVLLDKLSDLNEQIWYTQKTIENGWSRASLVLWIESDLYSRQGKAISNFKSTLPEPDSDLIQQTLKDPYNFDFLVLDTQAREREIELGLIAHMQKFLLELGQEFSLRGNCQLLKKLKLS